jgi:hypothetical protein
MSTVQVPKEELVSRAKVFNADAIWLAENLDEGRKLRRDYEDQYVAVHNEKVLDSDKDLRKLVSRLKRNYSSDDIGHFCIQYVPKTKIDLII